MSPQLVRGTRQRAAAAGTRSRKHTPRARKGARARAQKPPARTTHPPHVFVCVRVCVTPTCYPRSPRAQRRLCAGLGISPSAVCVCVWRAGACRCLGPPTNTSCCYCRCCHPLAPAAAPATPGTLLLCLLLLPLLLLPRWYSCCPTALVAPPCWLPCLHTSDTHHTRVCARRRPQGQRTLQ